MRFNSQGVGDWRIAQLLGNVESEALGQKARMANADTFNDVARCAEVSVPAEIRFMRNSIPALRSLDQLAEDRIEGMLKQRLALLTAAASSALAKSERGRLLEECQSLRGKFGRLYGYAERESQRLVYLKEQAEKRAEKGTSSPPTA